MRVLVVGAGLMGAQIGCEYALGGHVVTLSARDAGRVEERVARALATVAEHGLATRDDVVSARSRLEIETAYDPAGWDVVVESLPEQLELKAELLGPVAAASPAAIIASNTSSLSVRALGELAGAPERTVGTHYWNPPLLMPLVEVVPATADGAVVERVVEILETLGKRAVLVERDVPGFIWNRLQFALLRECVWLVENEVATPETVDEVVRQGLARRWRHVGPFQAIALGGVDTWNRAGANLVPELSRAEQLPDLHRWTDDSGGLAEVAAARDRALARELVVERNA
ncbi:MAG: 3-hydroxyacyl-CoA dehydrogenase family protein [Actinobacteria bacterium]|nr:3-hydroxyacyl-CoA dehydrogenase family protein [Actinomycetota bacterium]